MEGIKILNSREIIIWDIFRIVIIFQKTVLEVRLQRENKIDRRKVEGFFYRISFPWKRIFARI